MITLEWNDYEEEEGRSCPYTRTSARLVLAVEMKATTGERAAAFLAAAAAELLSILRVVLDDAPCEKHFLIQRINGD